MSTLELNLLDRDVDLPPESIPSDPAELLKRLSGPTLIRIEGRDRTRTRVVATLLHGNEPSGFNAVTRWLRSGATPEVDLAIFIGAVDTALHEPGFAYRTLPGRQDMNRCWLPPFDSQLGPLAERLLEELRKLRPEALIDVHNNTGHNPPYGVGPDARPEELRLVSLFGDCFILSDLRLASLVEGTRALCPSVTIECGRAGDPRADEIAHEGLLRFVAGEFGDEDHTHPIHVYAHPMRVEIRAGIELAFSDAPDPTVDLTVTSDIDHHNFGHLSEGVRIGWLREGAPWPLAAIGADGIDVSRKIFRIRDGILETDVPIVPVMMTTNPRNVLQDCLFYIVRDAD